MCKGASPSWPRPAHSLSVCYWNFPSFHHPLSFWFDSAWILTHLLIPTTPHSTPHFWLHPTASELWNLWWEDKLSREDQGDQGKESCEHSLLFTASQHILWGGEIERIPQPEVPPCPALPLLPVSWLVHPQLGEERNGAGGTGSDAHSSSHFGIM